MNDLAMDKSEMANKYEFHCSTPTTEVTSTSETFDMFRKTNAFKKMKIDFVPWRRGKPLNSAAKRLIANCYFKLSMQYPNMKDMDVQKMTCSLLGVGLTSIQHLKTEAHTTGKFSTPGKERPKARGTRTRTAIYDEATLAALRRKVHEFYHRHEVPTLQKIVEECKGDHDLPQLKERAMCNLLHDINFRYIRTSRKSALVDRGDIIDWRRRYLRAIATYRKEGRNIIFTDETWINAGHDKDIVWTDTKMSKYEADCEGLCTGLKQPTSKGQHLIIIHAGGENGFVPGALLIFKAKKGTADYLEELDGEVYQKWFKKQLLPALPPNTVIVMDSASYHSVKKDSVPTLKSLKHHIQEWLTEKGIPWESDMIKHELLALVEPLKATYSKYIVDEMAQQAGHTVLRLPPYHCELNPFEQVWSHIKDEVAVNNTDFKIETVKALTYEAFNNFTNNKWSPFVRDVIDLEYKMWELDGLMDDVIERIVISTGSDDEEEEECTDNENADPKTQQLERASACTSEECSM